MIAEYVKHVDMRAIVQMVAHVVVENVNVNVVNIHHMRQTMPKKPGLYANIHAKRKRIKAGSKEKMRKVGAKGEPTASQFKRAAKTAKKK